MKKIKYIGMALIAGILMTACDWHGSQTIIGTGEMESILVELPPVEGVSVNGSCKVDIKTGEAQAIEFFAQSEILDVLRYEVIDNILHIGFKPNYSVSSSKGITAHIVIPSVSFISITGKGDFELSGEQQELLDIHITGTGSVDAFDLEVEKCNIRISGMGDCEVNVIHSLEVFISGVGNVRYLGDPTLQSNVSGVGNVSPHVP